MHWVIYPKCPSSNHTSLYLTDDGSSCAKVTVLPPSGQYDQSQLWTPIFSVAANGFVLKNVKTNRLLQYTGSGALTAMVEDSCSAETATNQPTCVLNFGGENTNGVAVRPTCDTGQNLNVSGGGPYNSGNQVQFYGWGGGQPNEVWTFDCIDA